MLHGLGIDTGVDLDRLVATQRGWPGELGRPSPSRVVNALAGADGSPPRVGQNARMSRTVYLHIGAPKTGTSYLQDRLRLNKAELRRHGTTHWAG